jgi:hypothetical protein
LEFATNELNVVQKIGLRVFGKLLKISEYAVKQVKRIGETSASAQHRDNNDVDYCVGAQGRI